MLHGVGRVMAPRTKTWGREWQLPRWRLRLDDGQRLEYGPSWWNLLGGFIFIPILAGLVLILLYVRMPAAFAIPVMVVVCLGSLATLIFILHRGSITVDRVTKEVVRQFRIGPWRLRPTVVDGRQVEAVLFASRVEWSRRSGPGGASTVPARLFSVQLKTKDGRVEELDASSSESFQRAMAEKIAECLGVPLVRCDGSGSGRG